MNRCQHRWQNWIVLAAVSALTLAFTGCEGSGPSADTYAKNASDAELFTIPPEQMSHVQVLTVQPATLSRTLRVT